MTAPPKEQPTQPSTDSTETRMPRLPDPISVEEALRCRAPSVRVPDGETMTIGPFHAAASFRVAEIVSFKDLQMLGFVSDLISEEQAVKAVRSDERAHREAVRKGALEAEPCSCGPGNGLQPPRILRRRFQDHFIELLQPLYRQSLTADDPAVIHPFRRLQAWLERSSRYFVGLSAYEDIDIGRNATLTMTATVRALYANNINVEAFGRLRFQSGNVHVSCATLNGPDPKVQIEKHLPGFDRELMEVRT